MEFPEVQEAAQVIGIDNDPRSGADVIHDLNQFPYPLESGSFDLIILQDILEHLEDVPKVLKEVHRVAREGALVRIRLPHYSSYYTFNDPTHRQHLGALFLSGFMASSPNPVYGGPLFRLRMREIQFPKLWRVTGIAALANRFPARWEQLFAFVFRAENMVFELLAVKGQCGTPGTASREIDADQRIPQDAARSRRREGRS